MRSFAHGHAAPSQWTLTGALRFRHAEHANFLNDGVGLNTRARNRPMKFEKIQKDSTKKKTTRTTLMKRRASIDELRPTIIHLRAVIRALAIDSSFDKASRGLTRIQHQSLTLGELPTNGEELSFLSSVMETGEFLNRNKFSPSRPVCWRSFGTPENNTNRLKTVGGRRKKFSEGATK